MKQRIASLLFTLLTFSAISYAQFPEQPNGPVPQGAPRPASDKSDVKRNAKQQKQIDKQREKQERYRQKHMTNFGLVKTDGTTYVVGFSQLLGDTIVYITDINKIDSITVQKKTKFLPFRDEFSIQLKQYLEGEIGLVNQTCCVLYNKNKKKLAKKLAKLKTRYSSQKGYVTKSIPEEEFKFKHPLDMMSTNNDENE